MRPDSDRPCRLRENRGKAGEHVVHDGLGNGVNTSSFPGAEVKRARLIAADHADCPGVRAL